MDDPPNPPECTAAPFLSSSLSFMTSLSCSLLPDITQCQRKLGTATVVEECLLPNKRLQHPTGHTSLHGTSEPRAPSLSLWFLICRCFAILHARVDALRQHDPMESFEFHSYSFMSTRYFGYFWMRSSPSAPSALVDSFDPILSVRSRRRFQLRNHPLIAAHSTA